MTSWQHRLLVIWLRLTRRKRIYASVDGLYAGIAQTRRVGPALPGKRMCRQMTVSCELVDSHPLYQLNHPTASFAKPHVLYLHGGAYVRPITRFHWQLLEELVLETGCSASVPLYPLAPEADCKMALAFARKAYVRAQALAQGRPLILLGDSAGAGLALALATRVRDEGMPLLSHLALICPWVDLTLRRSYSPWQLRQDRCWLLMEQQKLHVYTQGTCRWIIPG